MLSPLLLALFYNGIGLAPAILYYRDTRNRKGAFMVYIGGRLLAYIYVHRFDNLTWLADTGVFFLILFSILLDRLNSRRLWVALVLVLLFGSPFYLWFRNEYVFGETRDLPIALLVYFFAVGVTIFYSVVYLESRYGTSLRHGLFMVSYISEMREFIRVLPIFINEFLVKTYTVAWLILAYLYPEEYKWDWRLWARLGILTLIASLYNLLAPWLNYTAYHSLGLRGIGYTITVYVIIAVNYLMLVHPILNVLKGDRV